MIQLESIVGTWANVLRCIFEDPQVLKDLSNVNSLYAKSETKIYPEQQDVFRAFQECPYSKFSAVIMMQDPYHDGSSTGLAAANAITQKTISPSLRIIQDTVCRTIYKGHEFDFDQTLIKWASQGILLLNAALTVEAGHPQSHQYLWRRFSTLLMRRLNETNNGIVYCFWGKQAEVLSEYIDHDANLVLYCTHPAYASYRGLPWDCNHFRLINEYLKKNNNLIINW